VQRSIGWNRDGTNFDGPKICGDKFWAVRQQQQNPLLFLYAKLAETIAHTVDVLSDLNKCNVFLIADDRCFLSATFRNMPVNKMCRQIVSIRKFHLFKL
jgi:hypothetical protein